MDRALQSTAFCNVSKSVYVGLCHKIGTPQQVTFRRDIMDIREVMINQIVLRDQLKRKMTSGSQREGFRFNESDIDTMDWPTNHRVIWNFSQSQFYNLLRQALILCDSSDSPPGFTLLWLPLRMANRRVLSACVRMNGRLFISSSKYIEIACSFSRKGSKVHGPCCSGTVDGVLDYDDAPCFVSDFWPPSASSWIKRCHSWPQLTVVNEIVGNGCHFVAIGHKLGNHEDNEWRISFSQAEQKLVYSMNHTQFLTYGLLKLFLKEIIHKGLRGSDKLLCSYHMKTAVFWVIQQNTLPQWCPQNLFAGFWICVKLILKWVYEGVCPNFFIPENNMFLSNVHGESQQNLFIQLYGLYEKGISVLLYSPTIGPYISGVLCNPRLAVCTGENLLISEVAFDLNLFHEIMQNDKLPMSNLDDCMEVLHTVENLLSSSLTQYQVAVLQKCTASSLIETVFILNNMYISKNGNNLKYVVDKMCCNILKLAARFGYVSDMLYIAMYYYNTSRYREALSVIEITKVKFRQPYLHYEEHLDGERYTEALGGQSWSSKMRRAVARDITLHNKVYYVNELILEQLSSSRGGRTFLSIPPCILLHMLEFLCYRYVDHVRSQEALGDLQTLINGDHGDFVPYYTRDISWDILGICRQITGDPQAALESFQQSLTEFPMYKIQNATRRRINDLQFPT